MRAHMLMRERELSRRRDWEKSKVLFEVSIFEIMISCPIELPWTTILHIIMHMAKLHRFVILSVF